MKKVLSILFFIGATTVVHAQGCSDAGICSVGDLGMIKLKYKILPLVHVTLKPIAFDSIQESLGNDDSSTVQEDYFPTTEVTLYNPTPSYSVPKLTIGYQAIYGKGDRQTAIWTHQLEAIYAITNTLKAQVKMPYFMIDGDLATNNGIGDVTASLTYAVVNQAKKRMSLIGGFKIPVNNSDASKDNTPLPMAYQTSLGTKDLLLGLSYNTKKWNVALAYQHPFGTNNNQYLHDVSQDVNFNQYAESKNLNRASDAVVRLSRSFALNKVVLSAGLLGIYHTRNDEYENVAQQIVAIEGSKGLTLNFNISSVYTISKQVDLLLFYANPLLIRDVRPAGLTRNFVLMVGVNIKAF